MRLNGVNLQLVIFFFSTSLCDGARILIISSGSPSHLLEADAVARQLLAANHEVFILATAVQKERIQKLNAKYQFVTINGPSLIKFEDEKDSWLSKACGDTPASECFTMFYDEIRQVCTAIMLDQNMWQQLEALKLDLVLVDNFYIHCLYLIPFRLRIPYVSLGTHTFVRFLRLPWLPSINQLEDSLETVGDTTCSEDSWCPRLFKVFRRLVEFYYSYTSIAESDYLKTFVDFPSIDAVRLNASLTLINLDYILEDYPQPELPNVVYVGGLTAQAAKPLVPGSALQKWMDAADCVTLVVFGTRVGNIDDNVTQRLLDAFGRVRCQVLFRCLNCRALKVPTNVRVEDWLPQNDVLGHRSTKAFVTHSGNNGQYEALYHGVPMVAFYIDGDQLRNARRIERKGFGKRVSFDNFDISRLAASINELLRNDSYRKAIQHASEIFKSYPHPAIRAAKAIERTLLYGEFYYSVVNNEHTEELSFVEFYSLDVLVILSTIMALFVFAAIKILVSFVRCTCTCIVPMSRRS